MHIVYEGHACLRCVAGNGEVLVMDPPAEKYGYILKYKTADYVTTSHDHEDHCAVYLLNGAVQIPRTCNRRNIAGSFEVSCISSYHDDQQGALRGENYIYRIEADGKTLVHLGDLGHMLSSEQAAFAEKADILAVPVGGAFTISQEQALETIYMLAPRYVLPIHYRTEQCSLQQLLPLGEFLGRWKGPVRQLECTEATIEDLEDGSEPVVLVMDYAARKYYGH